MKSNLELALEFVAKWEWGNRKDGGYTNDPVDPGGETKYGISKRAHPKLDIKNLTLEDALVLYNKEYWSPAGCSGLDLPLAVCVFDTAVNMGVSRALPFLQNTKEPIEYTTLRRNYYYNIVGKNPTQKKYLNGWLNRIIDLRKYVDILTTQKSV